MKKTKIHCFKDQNKLQEMLTLRAMGYTSTFLAVKYECDHSSILYHCEKHGVHPTQVIRARIERKIMNIPEVVKIQPKKKTEKYAHLIFERINRGKSYSSYLKVEHKRKIERYRALIAA